jgi:hypothetical protein
MYAFYSSLNLYMVSLIIVLFTPELNLIIIVSEFGNPGIIDKNGQIFPFLLATDCLVKKKTFVPDLSRRASVKVDGPKTVAFEAGNTATSPGEGIGNGAVVTVKPKSRSGSIIGAISPIMGTGKNSIKKQMIPSTALFSKVI